MPQNPLEAISKEKIRIAFDAFYKVYVEHRQVLAHLIPEFVLADCVDDTYTFSVDKPKSVNDVRKLLPCFYFNGLSDVLYFTDPQASWEMNQLDESVHAGIVTRIINDKSIQSARQLIAFLRKEYDPDYPKEPVKRRSKDAKPNDAA